MMRVAGRGWRGAASAARLLTLAVIALTIVPLAGCGLFEKNPDGMRISNLTDRRVVVRLEGTEFTHRTEVFPDVLGNITLKECKGTSITVQWEDGSPLATLDKAACPGTILRILKDETVRLEKRD